MHLVSGVAAVIGNGLMRTPTILKRDPKSVPAGERIIAETTSADMRALMRLVVQTGTGKSADVPGYDVGGKTGTAEKLSGHRYAQNARMAAFIGAFPMDAPRYVILVMVDEPKPNKSSFGYATGGWVAAPAVGRIVQRMAPMLGIEPRPAPDGADPNALLVSASATGGASEAE
jgi:cell division protein FtsI (penicillin-binding protein 3)